MSRVAAAGAALLLALRLAGAAGAAGPLSAAKDYGDIAEGLVVGFLGDEPSVASCVRAAAAELGDVEDAVLDLERRDAVDTARGLWKLGRAVRSFPTVLKSCKALEEDVVQAASALAQISGPVQFAYEMGRHLLVNWRDILKEVEDAVSDYQAGRFEGFGVDVGKALRKLILGSTQVAVPVPAETAMDIAGGLIEGFLSDMPDLKTCVRSGVAEFGDIEAAVMDFERRDAVDVARGLRKLADALQMFPSTMRACKAVEKDVVHIAGSLAQVTSPWQFAYEVGRHLLVNLRDILKEVQSAVVDFRARRFERFGIDIGTALRKLLVGSTRAALALPTSNAGEIAGGVIEGFLSDEPDLKRCVKAGTAELGDVQEAVRDFEKRDAVGFARGLWELGRALQGFPATLRACEPLESHVDKVVDALAQITRPFQFVYEVGRHLIINWHDIAQEVEDAIRDYRAGRFEGFGVDIGAALRKLVMGSRLPVVGSPVEAAMEIAGGLVEGFLSDQPDLKQCVKAGAAEFGDVAQAVRDFERMDAVDVASGFRKLAHALRLLPSILRACKAVEEDVVHIASSLTQITRPLQFAFEVGKHLIVNWHDIYTEIKDAIADFRARRFEGFGIDIGSALRKLIIGARSLLPELVV